MYKVAFRADGGSSIGMGHIMRCLSLAKEFRRQGCKVFFISKFGQGIEKIKEENFETIKLFCYETKGINGFDYGNETELVKETSEIIEVIKSYEIELLFIDSYNVNEEYFFNIKQHIKKLGYIDDVNKFIYPVDILINGNITGEYLNYKKYSANEVMLLGPKYNLIRDEFRELPSKVINKEVKEIMITTGGSDPYDISSKLINIISEEEEFKKVKLNVIIGGGFTNKEYLREIAKKNKNIILYENTKYMSEIMLKADIGISAGGSTLYELCACGTPAIGFIVADNQCELVEKMNELGYIISLGWYDEFSKEDLIYNLKNLCNDYSMRVKVSEYMQMLLDGKGTIRIVEEILNR